MHIHHLLHPEIVLGRRGPRNAILNYKNIIGHLIKTESGMAVSENISVEGAGLLSSLEVFKNHTLADHFFLVQKFWREKPPVYYLPESFTHALTKIDRELSFRFLPEEFFGYLAFPKDRFFIEEGCLNGGYVYLGCGPSNDLPPSFPPKQRYIMISLVGDHFDIHRLMIDLKDGKTLQECVDDINPTEGKKRLLLMFRVLLNAVLFIQHQDEDILSLQPTGNKTARQKREAVARNLGNTNECTIPVRLLNFQYHQKRQYSINSTTVTGHFRWQPHGPGRSRLKLIWIDEHLRQFGEPFP